MGKRPYILIQIEPYIHEQLIETNEVVITHGKDKPCPPVKLIDELGDEFEAEIKYLDTNSIKVKMNKSIKFTAYVY